MCGLVKTQQKTPSLKPGEIINLSSLQLDSNDTQNVLGLDSILEINEDDPETVLRELKAKNADRPILAHLNINFLESKFEPLKSLIKENIDILLISETKLDDTFPSGQFLIEGYKKPIRLDRNNQGGGILFFIRDDLTGKELKSHKLPSDVEGIFIENYY